MTRILQCLGLVFVTNLALAQVQPGLPAFAGLEEQNIDTVNVGTLNVHLDVPLFSRPGRGSSLTFHLVYDSAIWYVMAFLG
jgi:hypothetical protein